MPQDDWMSALQRLTTQGLPQDTALTADPGGPFGALRSRTERGEEGAEALPLGDPADPVSQIIMILAPLLRQYARMQTPARALNIPARRTLPPPALPELLAPPQRRQLPMPTVRSTDMGRVPYQVENRFSQSVPRGQIWPPAAEDPRLSRLLQPEYREQLTREFGGTEGSEVQDEWLRTLLLHLEKWRSQ